MTAKIAHPITFEKFYLEYINQLGAADRPSAYIAYVRTEAHFATDDFPRRYINHATFQSTSSRLRNRARKNTQPSIAL